LPGLLDTLNFSGFFPQLVAGPIERREDLLPQMETFRFRWGVGMVADGVSWVVLGRYLPSVRDGMAAGRRSRAVR
jgi:D-alanyl-lipoteichoic acid acyltransferase DltB (MBOAT superfamily)